jgi:hypothetical protein
MANLSPTGQRSISDPPGRYRSAPLSGLVELAGKKEEQLHVVDNVARRIADIWDSPPDPMAHQGDPTTAPRRMADLQGSAPTPEDILDKNSKESDSNSSNNSDPNYTSSGKELDVHSLLAAFSHVEQLEAWHPLIDGGNGEVDVDELGASAGLDVDDWAVILQGNNHESAEETRQRDVGLSTSAIESAGQTAQDYHDNDDDDVSTEIAANPGAEQNGRQS